MSHSHKVIFLQMANISYLMSATICEEFFSQICVQYVCFFNRKTSSRSLPPWNVSYDDKLIYTLYTKFAILFIDTMPRKERLQKCCTVAASSWEFAFGFNCCGSHALALRCLFFIWRWKSGHLFIYIITSLMILTLTFNLMLLFVWAYQTLT